MNKKFILISITVLAVAGVAWVGRAIYRAKKNIVTIDVYNVPLADVIKKLERQTWETILARADLQTKVTLQVKNGDYVRVSPTKPGTFKCWPDGLIERKLDIYGVS
jgi:hypothetical protein